MFLALPLLAEEIKDSLAAGLCCPCCCIFFLVVMVVGVTSSTEFLARVYFRPTPVDIVREKNRFGRKLRVQPFKECERSDEPTQVSR